MATDGIAGSLSVPGEQTSPDLMNDPQYATNTESNEDGTGDADTCRICRGEAAEQEPLFYPCKCSGSIKFVHQDCLMEWLSHSQKKHCELCKTPFWFTKLYAPNMPQSLPTHVFIRHLAIHTVKNLAIWLRFCLVVFVWLGCLPWAMRHVWGFLFWFGDGGWSSKMPGANSFSNDTAEVVLDFQKAREHLNILVANGTSPASPLLTRPTTSAAVGALLDNIPGLLAPVARMLNLSNTELFTMSFFKDIYSGLSLSSGSLNSTYTTQATGDYGPDISGHESLLSEVRFLKGLTRHLGFNRVIITALEGQIITIVVVVCFVLVFLIREWVVQQQPGINMGAGFNAEFAGGERAARNRNILPENAPDAEGLPVNGARNIEELHDVVQRPPADVAARPIARPRRRMVRFEDGQGHDPRPADRYRDASTIPQVSVRDGEGENAGEGPADIKRHQRPGTLSRDALSSAAEVQRQLAEDSSKQQDQFNASEFVSVWRRAGGSPEEVLRIIEAEGLGEKLRYWKNVKGLQTGSAHTSSPNGLKQTNGLISSTSVANGVDAQRSDETISTKQSWLDVPLELGIPRDHNLFPPSQENQNGDSLSSSDKGKQKMADVPFEPLLETGSGRTSDSISITPHPSVTDEEPSLSSVTSPLSKISFQSGPGRPRANSDWPQPRESISPLAENYWSFSNLPDASPNITTPGSTFGISEEFWKGLKAPSPEENRSAESKGILASASGQDHSSSISACDKPGVTSRGGWERIEIYNPESGTSRIAQSWEEEFANNPVSDSEDGFDRDATGASATEANPFHPDGILPEDDPLLQDRDQHPAQRQEPHGLWGRIANFLWGDVNVAQELRAGDDEHIVQDIAAEAPFVPVVHHHGRGIFDNDDTDDEGEVNQDREVLAAALAAGIDPNDPDGLDDVEDFDGIMELVGMRGPFTALIQNGIFSAVLISLTVACGVWLPYNIGRLVLLLIANPVATVKLPLKFLFSFAAVLQDLALVALGTLSYLLIQLCSLPSHLYSYATSGLAPTVVIDQSVPALESIRFAKTAAERIISGLVIAVMQIPDSEVPAFSAVSHEALLQIKEIITNTLQYVGAITSSILANRTSRSAMVNISMDFGAVWTTISDFGNSTVYGLQRMPAFLTSADSWVISLEIPSRAVPVDPSLSYWSGTDRFWAILAGYVALSLLGAAYLRKGSPFSTSQVGREWEATIIDILNQAGGVMKVILIISIEMLVFPLYCGLLLDFALLPLFENATILSRILFTIDSPLTSIFVHWFVGTCYMFHFALFVSMCRKIMRNGVLCKVPPKEPCSDC
jgi:E3 ubiquitin-protein ligase MARCH6